MIDGWPRQGDVGVTRGPAQRPVTGSHTHARLRCPRLCTRTGCRWCQTSTAFPAWWRSSCSSRSWPSRVSAPSAVRGGCARLQLLQATEHSRLPPLLHRTSSSPGSCLLPCGLIPLPWCPWGEAPGAHAACAVRHCAKSPSQLPGTFPGSEAGAAAPAHSRHTPPPPPPPPPCPNARQASRSRSWAPWACWTRWTGRAS